MFVLDLELGQEVPVPEVLSMRNLPHSFRFYDSIIQISQNLVSHQKSNLLGTQMAIIKQLDQNYTTPVLLGLKKANM